MKKERWKFAPQGTPHSEASDDYHRALNPALPLHIRASSLFVARERKQYLSPYQLVRLTEVEGDLVALISASGPVRAAMLVYSVGIDGRLTHSLPIDDDDYKGVH